MKWNGKKYVIIHAWVDKSDKDIFDVLPDREMIKVFPWAIYRRDWQKVLPIVGQEGECLDLVEYYKIMVNRDNGVKDEKSPEYFKMNFTVPATSSIGSQSIKKEEEDE